MIHVEWILNPVYSESVGEYLVTWTDYFNSNSSFNCSLKSYMSTYGSCSVDLMNNTLYTVSVSAISDEGYNIFESEDLHIFTNAGKFQIKPYTLHKFSIFIDDLRQ